MDCLLFMRKTTHRVRCATSRGEAFHLGVSHEIKNITIRFVLKHNQYNSSPGKPHGYHDYNDR